MSAWKHDELAIDLATHLRGPERMVWTDMQLGPSGSPRPDVFTIQRSYSRPAPTAYECKVSRSDFRADITKGKWQSYLAFAGSVTFAVPDGLITPADVPEGCGLIVRKDAVWRYARKPTIQLVTLASDAWMKLLLDGRSREFVPALPRSRQIDLWKDDETIRRKFGAAVATAARDLVAVEKRIAGMKGEETREHDRIRKDVEVRRRYLMEQAQAAVASYEEAKRTLCEWLELDGSASTNVVHRRIAALRAACDADHRVREAERKLSAARQSLSYAMSSLESKEAA